MLYWRFSFHYPKTNHRFRVPPMKPTPPPKSNLLFFISPPAGHFPISIRYTSKSRKKESRPKKSSPPARKLAISGCKLARHTGHVFNIKRPAGVARAGLAPKMGSSSRGPTLVNTRSRGVYCRSEEQLFHRRLARRQRAALLHGLFQFCRGHECTWVRWAVSGDKVECFEGFMMIHCWWGELSRCFVLIGVREKICVSVMYDIRCGDGGLFSYIRMAGNSELLRNITTNVVISTVSNLVVFLC